MDLTALRATAWSCLIYVWALAVAHPAVTTLIVGSTVSRILKPRTPEEYASIAQRHPVWFFARVAALLQLLGAIFVDSTKAQKIILEKIFKGPPKPPRGPSILPPSDPPPPPPSAPAAARAVLAAAAIACAFIGCHPAAAPREQARSVVLTVAEGVRVADETCASIALGTKSAPLAEQCAAIVKQARESLIAAEDGVDAWDAAAARNLPCSVKAAASALSRILTVIENAGGKVPPVVADALRLAPTLAGVCHG